MARSRKTKAARLKAAAAVGLLDADDADEELLCLLLARKASKLLQPIPRGPYDAVKSSDFIFKLMDHFSERSFKAYLRYV